MAKKFLTGLNLVVLNSDPATGSEGELYFNSSASVAKIYQAGAWSVLGAGGGGTTVSTTEPPSPEIGDSWYKNDTGEFYVYDGTYWVEVNGVIASESFKTISVSGQSDVVADSNTDTLTLVAGTNVSITTNSTNDSITINADSKSTSSVYLVRNNTGSTILKGTLVSASGAEPSGRIDVEPFAAVGGINSELTVMGMATANISNGVNGEVISFGTLTGLDTRGDVASGIAVGDETWAAGDILFAHPTVAGKLTKVRPQHDLAVAFITVRHASTGQIAVRIVPGNNHLEWMHDVLISGSVQNNEILSYDLSNGLWINKTANESGIATTEDLSEYLTTSSAAVLYQPFSVRLFNLTALEGAPGVLRSDGGLGWSLDPTEFLSTFNASSTYLTQVDASDIYLTQVDAGNTYLTSGSANSLYQPLDADLTTIAALSGSSGFLKKNIFDNWVIDSNTYLTTYDASTLYQTTGDYATISGVETLSNKTMSVAFISGNMTFNDIDYQHTISSGSNNLTITGYNDLNLVSANGSIVLQPDEFVKIYDEHVATQEWVDFQDYLTQVSASTIYQPIGSYSTTSHNHTLDSLSNVVITGTPSDGQAIVWDTSTSKWVNETVSGGASYPDQTGNDGKFLQTNSGSVSWQNVNLTGYLTETSASTTYLTKASASTTYQPAGSYLTSESDTFETVTDRGASSTNAITISNTTEATNATTGALIVSGGVGVAKDLWIDGNLHVAGTTTTENTKTVATHDNLIYLNAALDSTITNAVFSSGSITYTAENLYTAGMDIRITGVSPSAFNISSGDLLTVASATPTQFVVIKSDPGASYISGGTAHAKEEANSDLGFAGGYYSGGYAHAGLFRDASDGVFKFFQGYTPEPDEAVNIDTTHASFALADISINRIIPGSSGYNPNNFGIGQYALDSFDVYGYENFAIGTSALGSGVGFKNYAFGDTAGLSLNGYYNYAIGNSALILATGEHNYAFGLSALASNVDGIRNYAVGQSALTSNSGNYNYAFGSSAGSSNTGDNNLFLGKDAGYKNSIENSGDYNVYIGKSEGLSTSNNIVIADNEGNIRAQYLSASSGWTLGNIVSGTWNGSTIGYQYGGTGLTTLGTAGQVLTVNAGATALEWADASGGSSFTNSSELAALLSDETGSGSVVFSNSPTLTTPNIGAATGTSLTTTGNVISHVDISTPTFVTNSYTITSTDDGKLLMLNNSTTAGNLLIPTDATFNFPIGTQINVVQQGTGLITVGAVTPATTTINATPGKKLRAQWSSAAIVKTAANTWLLMGDLTV